MGKKIEEIASKIYKPEILVCPFCGGGLKYKYTVSNKVVQFTSGKYYRIKNLGYGCMSCNDGNIYFSQTANKLCFKGYTYSAKIVCMIAYYKEKHLGRESICDILASKGVEISDRNIDILYKKYREILAQDYDTAIREAYRNMREKYGEIRLSVDLITVNECRYVILYDFFTSAKLALWVFRGLEDPGLAETLSLYIRPDLPITLIASVRNTKEGRFLPILKKLAAPSVRFIAFNKF